jgi:phosphoribosyl-AMP cyclohydrolase
MSFSATLKYDANGLIPVVTQDADNHQVLMVAYMNADAVEQTLTTGHVTYWSRSRQKFWIKGETSGHYQHLIELRVDCDEDCLLALVRQEGVACHEGYRSCFFRAVEGGAEGELVVKDDRPLTPEQIYGKR